VFISTRIDQLMDTAFFTYGYCVCSQFGCEQWRIFIFGLLGILNWGLPLKVCGDWCNTNQHYTCSLHSLSKLLQLINIFLCSEFPRYQEREPCQPPSIHTPQLGCYAVTGDPKFRAEPPKQNFNPPNWNMKH